MGVIVGVGVFVGVIVGVLVGLPVSVGMCFSDGSGVAVGIQVKILLCMDSWHKTLSFMYYPFNPLSSDAVPIAYTPLGAPSKSFDR